MNSKRCLNSPYKTPIPEMEKPMVSPKRLNNLCLIAASTTVLLAAGCSHQPPSESDTASSGAEITETARLENTQTAAGALRGVHSLLRSL